MTDDREVHLAESERRDLWALPEIESLRIERVGYREPRQHVVSGKVVEFSEGVEIAVRTTGEIPIRALSPALHVGDIEVAENEQLDATSYRFFVLDEEALEDGAPISLGWVGHPPPERRTKFRYEGPGDRVTRRG
jgi:hypothetical protein